MGPESSAIDAAIVAVLAGDATLKASMPDGVFFDEAPPGLRAFVIVSLFNEDDIAVFGERAIEDAVYVIKAVSLGTSGAAVKAAAARIDALLEDTPLVVDGYAWGTTHREQRIRYPEVDAVDPSIRWQHRGGHYRVTMTPKWGA